MTEKLAMSERVETFWMVYREGGQGSTYKHLSRESAQAEAARLARGCDSRFYVLEAREWVEAVTIRRGVCGGDVMVPC
jgi:hypothetical protein